MNLPIVKLDYNAKIITMEIDVSGQVPKFMDGAKVTVESELTAENVLELNDYMESQQPKQDCLEVDELTG